eukprot:5502688-Alexandrium_andersonii.AAC.1
MNAREKLRVLQNCLEQSRGKVYRMVVRAAPHSGELEQNPKAVYERVIGRLMVFKLSLIHI